MTILKDHNVSSALDTPLYQQLYSRIRTAILSGDLKRGMKLPSTRALAGQLNVSRNTVLNAYQQLMVEGYLDSMAGNGTFVARVLPEQLFTPPGTKDLTSTQTTESEQLGVSNHTKLQLATPQLADLLPGSQAASRRPFRFGVPALEAFPYKLWSRLLIRRARNMPINAFAYQNLTGYRPLREAIAAHIKVSRRVQCTPDQIIIVPGAQEGLDLAARILINEGQSVWMEDPGYLQARGAFLGSGAEIIPVPVDQEGLVVETGIVRAPQARLAYVTPSHQFPLGVMMSLPRRLALLDWAKRAHAYILEDDYDSEYHFTRRPLPALQGLDDAGRVIYIGTFSKMLFPALGIGYLILPQPLVSPAVRVLAFINIHPPILEQMVLTDFITEGHLSRHLRRMRNLYAERRAALLEAAQQLPLEIHPPESGIHCVGWLPEGMDDISLAREATAHDINLIPISGFSIESMARKGIMLGYGEYSVDQIKDGIGRLAAAMCAL